MPRLTLSPEDRAMLSGGRGPARELAMRVVVAAARAVGAPRLIDITSAHIDGCLYHGPASLDFARRLVDAGARVAVPSTLNVGSLDLLHPHLYRGDPETAAAGRRLMDLYAAMGCEPTWTCAPYQLPRRPGLGEQVAWAESNAVVFANSVLGARTERYGDFLDVCAAITGRVPDAGLHREENRRGRLLFRLQGIPEPLLQEESFYPVLGHLVGLRAGPAVPVIEGLPAATSEDRLRALGAAAASSGSVALFHAVGVTPEAPTLEEAFHGRAPEAAVEVTAEDVERARDALCTVPDGDLRAVSVGTPHFSVAEFEQLVTLLAGGTVHPAVELYVSTGRHVLREVQARGWAAELERAGVTVVVDTCTYVSPILRGRAGVVMTNSAKWATYAPANLGVEVVFGSLRECVRSAVEGRVWRDPGLWGRRPGRPRDGSGSPLPPPAVPAGPPAGPTRALALAPGEAAGRAAVLDQPLSFWGGMDPGTGRIIDRRHPRSGTPLTGRVVVMPSGRGSSSSSSVLAEAARRGTGPAAVVLLHPDLIVALGSLVAAELYGRGIPVVVAPEPLYRRIREGDLVRVRAPAAGGEAAVRVRPPAGPGSP